MSDAKKTKTLVSMDSRVTAEPGDVHAQLRRDPEDRFPGGAPHSFRKREVPRHLKKRKIEREKRTGSPPHHGEIKHLVPCMCHTRMEAFFERGYNEGISDFLIYLSYIALLLLCVTFEACPRGIGVPFFF